MVAFWTIQSPARGKYWGQRGGLLKGVTLNNNSAPKAIEFSPFLNDPTCCFYLFEFNNLPDASSSE